MLRDGRLRVQELVSSWASGVVLILSGLAVAAYGMPFDTSSSAAPSVLQADIGDGSALDRHAGQDRGALGRLAASRSAFAARATEPMQDFTAPVVVTIAPRPSEPAAALSRAAAIPRDRDALARELQKELRRVGCYDGELNGAWTPSTRRAMKAFTDRVNATLPVDEPDDVLFVMVQGQQDRVCGKACPVGQGISEDGRCLPSAILAKPAKRAPPPATVAQLPKSDPGWPVRRGPAIASWSATVTAAPASPLAVAEAPAAAPIATEGRMGLAGPMEEPKQPAASSDPVTAKPLARSRVVKRPRSELRVVAAPRRGVFARTVFRRIDSSL